MEKWDCGPSKKKFLRRWAGVSVKAKYPAPFRGGVPGEEFFIRLKKNA
jgi:hypothetical protein